MATRCLGSRGRRGRLTLAGLLVLGAALGPGAARAEESTVPAVLQAALLVKVAAYDQHLPARAGDTVRTLIVYKASSDDSVRVATQLRAALGERGTIVDLPHAEEMVTYQGPGALAPLCRARKAAIIYLSTGFSDEEIVAVAAALNGVDVLTAGAVPAYVKKGVILGFDLVSGKPTLLVNLAQCHKQHVSLSAHVLRLMTVVQ